MDDAMKLIKGGEINTRMNNTIVIPRDSEKVLKIPENVLRDSKIKINDLVGFASLNHYTNFPLIRGVTISDDLSSISIPEDLEPRTGDHINLYIFEEKR